MSTLCEAIEIGGQSYRASVVETAPSRAIIKDGKFITTPAERALVPEWLEKAMAPILQAKDLQIKVGLAQHLSDAIADIPSDKDAVRMYILTRVTINAFRIRAPSSNLASGSVRVCGLTH